MNLPKLRSRNIVVQAIDAETLVYDLDNHKAFRLNESLTVVFNHCNSATTIQELKAKFKYTDDFINLALDELYSNSLLESERSKVFDRVSRRDAVRRIGLTSMIALPVIVGLVAPTAANAASDACGGCSLPNATAICVSGTCQIASCNVGFANCDGLRINGCETNISTSSTNCGACGNVCAALKTCISSACV